MVKALIVDDSKRYPYLWMLIRERFLNSLAVVPIAGLVIAVLLAWVARYADRYLIMQPHMMVWLVGTTSSAIAVTSVIATSMLSFLAVVFSITLVALQLASQQFSPRVLRIFARSTVVKMTLGLFIATFAFSLVLLSEAARREEIEAPLVSLSMAILLVFTSIIVFVEFVATIINMMRIGNIIKIVADETRAAIIDNFLPEMAYAECEARTLEYPIQIIAYDHPRASPLVSRDPQGVLEAISYVHLVQLARQHNCVLQVLPRVGEYIVSGTPVVEVYGSTDLDPRQVLATLMVGPERTLFQDPAFGFRTLVDIAAQALSAAVNAPTTASQVIERLIDLLLEIARRPAPSGYYADEESVLRLVRPVFTWPEYVDLAFTEIIEYGGTASQVRQRLLQGFDQLLREIPETYRPAIEKQRSNLNSRNDAL